jgi:nucleoside-diphosphate-sugar epimerase
MKILVTGAAGFLGIHVIERLLAHDYSDIRCLLRDRNKAVALRMLAERYPQQNLDICIGNLRSGRDAANAVDGVSLIFHLAAAMKGSAADMFLDTVVASRNLVDALEDCASKRIVLVSSFGVYGTAELNRGALVDETTPLESHPAWRDPYSYTKLQQEKLLWELQAKKGFEFVVLRPGIIYGPGGAHFSDRVGLNLLGTFLHLGGNNLLPIAYADNCAEAIVCAGLSEQAPGQVYNIHDDQLITSRQYLRAYQKNVRKVRSISIPYPLLMILSRVVESYHKRSRGQLPAIFTPYKTMTMWGGNKFSNAKLRSIGWNQLVDTQEGLRRTFESFRTNAVP